MRASFGALALCLCISGCGVSVESSRDFSGVDFGPGGPDLINAEKPACQDSDGDGYGVDCPNGLDCNDSDPAIHPGAREICEDGKDNNCNGGTDEPGCVCPLHATRDCYSGPAGTAGVGVCKAGVQLCGISGDWDPCTGEVVPSAEVCDGKDNDCNNQTDEGLLNACGACGTLPAEICFNGFDDNCNGQTDEGCGTCDPGCQCSGGSCSCQPPTNQPCYSGPPQTSGVGVCKQGKHDCVQQADLSWKWGPCTGQVLPGALKCDGSDNNCDGAPDDGPHCPCVNGATRSCSSSVGACTKGTQTCSGGNWSACTGTLPATEVCDGVDNDCDGFTDEGVTNTCGACGAVPAEVCGNQLDDDCDGLVDEAAAGCNCGGMSAQACYRGPANTLNVGTCKAGMQACVTAELLEDWGPCMGDVIPRAEICGNGLDEDCDGTADDGCICTSGQSRPCGTSAVGLCKKGTQSCVNGVWGMCNGNVEPVAETCDGKDNDCDGLTDEGVLNACGKCPPAPCYTEDYPTPGDCTAAGRTCNSVVPDPSNPNAITLGDSVNQLLPYIYIAVTNRNEVAQINTETGVKQWQKPSFGVVPSRTAVALDGTVWVGNRCLIAGRDNDFTCSNMVHLDLNGNLICRADVPGWVRGVAIDGDGNVWAGAYNGMRAWKVSGTAFDNTQNPPRCQIIGSVGVTQPIYGLAIDGRGFLWTSTSPTFKINVATISVVDTVPNPSHYGIAIDKQNRVWFGGWRGGPNPGNVHRIDGDSPYSILDVPNTPGVTAVTVHPDGTIWGSIYDAGAVAPQYGVAKLTLNAAGTAVMTTQKFAMPENANPHGIAVDKANKVWTPQRFTGRARRWLPTGVPDALYDVQVNEELYSYSDMTGIQLRTITTREGHWLQQFDSAYLNPVWDHMEWTATLPAGTSVTVQARAADNPADFAGGTATAWCGPFSTSPASLGGCAFVNGHRYLQLDVKLNTTIDGVRPTVSDIKVFWSY